MHMSSKDYLPDQYVITCIKTVNKNNTASKFQSEQSHGILQGVINRKGIKQAQNYSNR